jgi:predicted membrane protein
MFISCLLFYFIFHGRCFSCFFDTTPNQHQNHHQPLVLQQIVIAASQSNQPNRIAVGYFIFIFNQNQPEYTCAIRTATAFLELFAQLISNHFKLLASCLFIIYLSPRFCSINANILSPASVTTASSLLHNKSTSQVRSKM